MLVKIFGSVDMLFITVYNDLFQTESLKIIKEFALVCILNEELQHLILAGSPLCIFPELSRHLMAIIFHALVQNHIAVISELAVGQHPCLDCLIYRMIFYYVEFLLPNKLYCCYEIQLSNF